jgi:hypothetical protein
LVAVAVYIYGVVTKPRFPSGSEIKYEDKLVEDLYRLPTKGMRRWIVPFQAEANIVGYREVRFRASGNRNKAIVLPVGEQVEGMSVNKARLEPGERDELLMPGDQLRYRENGSTWTYTYMSP